MLFRGQYAMDELKQIIKEEKLELLVEYKNAILVAGHNKRKLTKLQKSGIRSRLISGQKELQINGFSFNPSKAKFQSTKSNALGITGKSGEAHHLLRPIGPLHKDWMDKLKSMGVRIHEQALTDDLLVTMDNNLISKVKKLKFVESLSPYYPEMKISSALLSKKEQTELSKLNNLKKINISSKSRKVKKETLATVRKNEKPKERQIELVLFDKKNAIKLEKEIKALGIKVIENNKDCIIVQSNGSQLIQLASLSEIKAVNPYGRIVLHNNMAETIIEGDTIQNNFSLDGSNQIIAVADTGLDRGVNDATMSPDFRNRIISIYALGRPGDASDLDGHGTHVAGSVLGSGDNSNNNVRGLAPAASLVFQSLEDATGGLGGIPANLGVGLFDVARDDGARIHTNSWGADNDNAYTFRSNQADQFAFQNRDFLILFSAGNDAPNGIGSPGTAKNVFTIGASENDRAVPATVSFPSSPRFPTGVAVNNFDQNSDDINDIAGFSSIGPAVNNRIKPDVVAPGTWILSARSRVNVYDSGPDGLGPNEVGGDPNGTGDEDGVPTHAEAVGLGLPGQPVFRAGDQNTPALPPGSGAGAATDYMYLSGTSMATPIVAGSCGLIRQYLMEQRNHLPSAALIKAIVVNGANLMGVGQNFEGWGRVDLENAIAPTGTQRIQFDDSLDNSVETGDIRTYTVHVPDSSNPLVVTLVWRDPAAATIQNQLFLRLRHVSSGSEFTFETEETPVLNNVQKVIIPSPSAGTYEIEVEAINITQGIPEFPGELKQDFALVVANAVGFSCNPSDIVQVIDRSGSMGFYGYMEPAKQRASELVDILKINDSTGVVSFASSSSPGVPTPLTPVNSQLDKNAIKTTISTISSSGMTDLREALVDGIATLGPDTGRPRSIIFISDGEHTVTSAPIDNVFLDGIAAQNIRVYTIALGSASDIPVLDNIANRTGTGGVHLVDSPSELYKLHEIYYDILGDVDCGSVIHLNSETVFSNSERTDHVVIAKTAKEVSFMVSWEAGVKKVSTILESPSGKKYSSNKAINLFSKGDTYHNFRIPLPESGRWKVKMKGRSAGLIKKMTLGVISETDVKFSFKNFIKGSNLKFVLEAIFGGKKIANLNATAILRFPAMSTDELLIKYQDELKRIKINKKLLKGARDNMPLAKLNILAARYANKGKSIITMKEEKIEFRLKNGAVSGSLNLKKLNFSGVGELRLEVKAKGKFGTDSFVKIIPVSSQTKRGSKPRFLVKSFLRRNKRWRYDILGVKVYDDKAKEYTAKDGILVKAQLKMKNGKRTTLTLNYSDLRGYFFKNLSKKEFGNDLKVIQISVLDRKKNLSFSENVVLR